MYQAEEIEKRVKVEDFPLNFQRTARNIGVEQALELVKLNGGINLYVPVYDCVTAAARDRLIKEDYRDGNYKQLAIKYGLSEMWVRDIIDRDRRQKAREFMAKNQGNLFEGFI